MTETVSITLKEYDTEAEMNSNLSVDSKPSHILGLEGEVKNLFFILNVINAQSQKIIWKIGLILEGLIKKPIVAYWSKTKSIGVGLDRSFTVFSMEDGSIRFSKNLIYAIFSLEISPSETRLIVIHETGCEVIDENGNLVNTWEGEIVNDWKVNNQNVLLMCDDGSKKEISLEL